MLDSERIANFKAFEGLSGQEIDAVLAISEELTFDSDQVVLEESSLGSNVYLLLEGRVGVGLGTSEFCRYCKEERELAILRKGDVFGEMAFLLGRRRSARVRAIDKIRVLKMDGERLRDLFEANNHAGYLVMRNLAAILAQRLVDLNFRWRESI